MARLTLHPGHKLAWLTLSLLTAGCANNGISAADALPRISTHPRVSDIYRGRSPEVMRYDRYTLVSTRPADAQRDPLNQMVDITMPAQLVRSVGDGFRYLLLESGYSLCPASSSAFVELLSRPLPAVQRSIGPVRLSEALQVLAGPAWRLRVDDVNREVCFTLRDAYRDFVPRANTSVAVAPRLSGNPFSASSPIASKVTPSTPPLTVPAAVQSTSGLTPESVPVPSPVLAAMKRGANVSNSTIPGTKPTVPVTSAYQMKQAVQPLTKPLVPVIPMKTPGPVKNTRTHSSAPTGNPVFTPGAPVMAAPSGQRWRAEVGSTLKETLTRWAGVAKCDNGGDWAVIWPVSLDYRIDAPLVFHGNFESVLVQIFDLYRQAEKPLYAVASRMQCLVSVSDHPGRH
ncbi:pilus assembly protein [Prodigiosinella confusarubida]|uniref:Pilus assembly protein n=1 Tax=Serratia sp. (strain ATCC 39006) TaxID=104623 RepID=A0A2I5TNU1_SERS3|nr:TcpQ domain-containing protein [Serratia sp. ATCC 39006]AUH01903.1 pilus assembly protein [Serratia sp. ATCC 39006]AUH06225.1 pilus assembly protein [Serratia sp. ATCC 39006]